MAASDPDPDVPPALEERVLAEYGWVRALAARLLRSAGDADDVTQEVVAAALARQPRLDAAGGVRRWLAKVTRVQAARFRARSRRRRDVEAEARRDDPSTPEPRDLVDRLQMHRALTDAVLGLPEPYRAVIVARYLDGLSNAQIAAGRGVREATVRQQLQRAIHMLRTKLSSERGRGWQAGLVLLAFGGERIAAPELPAHAEPTTATLAATAAAVSTMKTLLAVLFTICALVLGWQMAAAPTAPGAVQTAVAPATLDRARELAATRQQPAGSELARHAVPAPEPAANGFVLRVVDHAGAPLPDVTVVLVADQDVIAPSDFAVRTTDRDGRVPYAEPPPKAPGARGFRLLLAAASRAPEWTEIELPAAGSERVVSFGGPGTVRGVVKTLGDAAALGAEANALPRWLDCPQHRYRLELPLAITETFVHLGQRHLLQGAIRVDADDGTFAMHGLPESESTVSVGLPYLAPFVVHPEHTIAERVGRESAVLRVGRSDHVLGVVPIPAMRLRAVFDDGAPAVGAEVQIRAWLADDDGPLTGTRSDADGVAMVGSTLENIPLHRYLDPADQPRVMRIDVWVSHPAAAKPPKFTFEMPSGVRWADAGEVVLQRLAEVHVLAVDRTGVPVRGAVFDGTQRSQPSGSDGRTVVRDEDADRRAFRIGAPGSLVDRYEAVGGSGTAADPLRFELAPENRVVLHLACEDLRADEVRLHILGPEDLFHSAHERIKSIPSHLHRAAGSGRFLSGSREQRSAEFDDDLTFTFVSLVPGARVTATALDGAGVTIAECEFEAPPFGAARHVRMVPEVSFCRVDGRIVASDGAPVSARLGIGEDRKVGYSIHRARTSTDRSGRFRLRLVATGEEVTVRVLAEGHSLLRERLSLVAGAQERWFTMQKTHSLTARLVGHDGETLDVPVEVVKRQELAVTSERLPDKSTRLSGLPPAEITLVARYACRRITKSVDTASQGIVELRAPRAERVPLRVAPHVARDTVLILSIFSTADDADRVHLQLHNVDGTWQPSEIPLYPGEYLVRCDPFTAGGDLRATWTVTEGQQPARWLMQ